MIFPVGFRRAVIGYLIVTVGCLVTAGCAAFSSVNPATGKKEFILFSTEDEVELGDQFHRQITAEMTIETDGARVQRLRAVGASLAAASDRRDVPYRFFVVGGDEWNAFTIPGGRIYVYGALMDAFPRDDEVAAVVAHEIGHVAARHTIKKFQAALGYDLLKTILFDVVIDRSPAASSSLARVGTDVLMNIVFSSYGRRDELEADRLAIRYMIRAGYDPTALIHVFEALARKTGSSWTPAFLRTHPLPAERIRQAERWIVLWRESGLTP